MSFVSVEFFLFLTLLLIMYFLVPKKSQWKIVPIFSIWFYCSYGIQYFLFIMLTVLITYVMGLVLNKEDDLFKEKRKQCEDKEQKKLLKNKCTKKKKTIMLIGLMTVFGIWIVFKYVKILNFFPLGVSIYTFIAAGYCIDVYRGKYCAERNLIKYVTFVTFFPHIVQGPFSRYDVLGQTLFERHEFDFQRLGEGMLRMAWGYFKKLVIANRLSVTINIIMVAEAGYGGIYVLLLFFVLPFRLYADFSGYMDIVVGLCHVMGIRIQENFMQPFFARTIDEFWRRWHITLGAWFRDYLFYPVSMCKLTQTFTKRFKRVVSPTTARSLPSYVALIFVWSATGLWHGNSVNYLLWGWINLFCIVSSMQFKPMYIKIKKFFGITDESRIWKLIQMIRTLLIFGLAEMVSDTKSVYSIWSNCKSLIMDFDWQLLLKPFELLPGLTEYDCAVLLIGGVLLLIIDVMKEKGMNIYGMVHNIPFVIRYAGCVILFYSIIVLGNFGTDVAEGFMYAQF